ncbi:MAG: PilZ domain-containing protein [Candidatus Omnitrophica bacterium]|nr:PilZ domain-containing protein [Candidatus Omnitrophota bacterium]
MTNNISDKRKAKRFNCLVPVDGKEGSLFSSTKTVDISKDGIGFVSSHAIPLNEKIAIELALSPETEPVLVIGQVKWVRKITDSDQFRVGLTFSDIIDGSRDELDSSLSGRFSVRENV